MKVVLFSLLCAVSSGCAMGPYINPGLVSSVDGPITVSSHSAASKTGKACAHNVMGIAAFGDNSIKAASKQGGIKKIATADYDLFNILGIYTRVCTNVAGE